MASVFETAVAANLKGSMNPAFGLSAVYTGLDGTEGITITVRVQRGEMHEVEKNGLVIEVQSGTVMLLQADAIAAGLHPTKHGRFTIGSGTDGVEVWTIELVPILRNGELICSCSRQGTDASMSRRARNA